MDPHLLSRSKAWWAVGLQDHIRLLHRQSRLADAATAQATRSPVPTATANADDDAVIIDSPSTINHYHREGPPLGAVIAVIASALVVTALLIGIAVVTLMSGSSPTSPPTPASRPGDYLEFFEP